MGGPGSRQVGGAQKAGVVVRDYPKALCGNCHVYRNSEAPTGFKNFPYVLDPNLFSDDRQVFNPPTPCIAELKWPERLTHILSFLERRPLATLRNFLQTLMISRPDAFPLKADASLRVYLFLASGVPLPPLKGIALQVRKDADLCIGRHEGHDLDCQGFSIDMHDREIGMNIKPGTVLSGNERGLSIEIGEILGVPELGSLLTHINIKNIKILNGRIYVIIRLGDPFLNAGLPLLKTALENKGLTLSANPSDPHLYDVDVTQAILSAMPVGYDSGKNVLVSYKDYQKDSSGIEIFPYLYLLAHQGYLYDRLSFDRLFEIGRRIASLPLIRERKKTSSDALSRVFRDIKLEGSIQLRELVHSAAYILFSKEKGKNLATLTFRVHELRDFFVDLTSSIDIDRFYLPGILDIESLQGDLSVAADDNAKISLGLTNFSLDLAPMEYFQSTPNKNGIFAVLGGQITSFVPGATKEKLVPALHVTGNHHEGFQVQMNLQLRDVRVRLPGAGLVTLNGQLSIHLEFVPTHTHGWTLKPGSQKIEIKNLSGRHNGTQIFEDASLELSDTQLIQDSTARVLSFVLKVPRIHGQIYKDLNFSGATPIPLTQDQVAYDLKALPTKSSATLSMIAHRHGGTRDVGRIDYESSKSDSNTWSYQLKATVTEKSSQGLGVRKLIDDLKIALTAKLADDAPHYEFRLDAPLVNTALFKLIAPHVHIEVVDKHTESSRVVSVPKFEITANPTSGFDLARCEIPRGVSSDLTNSQLQHGLTQGPVCAQLQGKPPLITWDKPKNTLDIKDVSIRWGIYKLTLPLLKQKWPDLFSSLDIEGWVAGLDLKDSHLSLREKLDLLKKVSFNDYWDLMERTACHYKIDLNKFQGNGSCGVVGDNEGDIHLRDTEGHRLTSSHYPGLEGKQVETPMLFRSTWVSWFISGLNREKEWFDGQFQLCLMVDQFAALKFGDFNTDPSKALGACMLYDHMPFSPAGFLNKRMEYYTKKLREQQESRPSGKKKEAP